MKRELQIFIMIFTLGLFIAPSQNLFAKSETMSCCNTETTGGSCHQQSKKDSGCNETHNNHANGCTDNCCNICNGCHAFFVPVIEPEQKQKIGHIIFSEKKSNFNYTSPHLSTGLKEIWQPPKIA